jgi:hypothetical protein
MVTRGIRSMVIGPGGCRFGDSWRLGLPLLVLVPARGDLPRPGIPPISGRRRGVSARGSTRCFPGCRPSCSGSARSRPAAGGRDRGRRSWIRHHERGQAVRLALVCQALARGGQGPAGGERHRAAFNSLAACGRPATATSACPSDFWTGGGWEPVYSDGSAARRWRTPGRARQAPRLPARAAWTQPWWAGLASDDLVQARMSAVPDGRGRLPEPGLADCGPERLGAGVAADVDEPEVGLR